MKKALSILILLICTLLFIGCAKEVDREYREESVTVTDIYHRGMYTQMVRIGKTMSTRVIPAQYRVTFTDSEGFEYTVSGSSCYNEFKDKEGSDAKIKFCIIYYEDGRTKKYVEEVIYKWK